MKFGCHLLLCLTIFTQPLIAARKLILPSVFLNGIKTDNRESNLCVLDTDAHNHFHDWLRWKVENDGRYPTKRYQRAILRYRYNGILLVTFPNDLPPFDRSEPDGGRNNS